MTSVVRLTEHQSTLKNQDVPAWLISELAGEALNFSPTAFSSTRCTSQGRCYLCPANLV
jgi:hypothetical protein